MEYRGEVIRRPVADRREAQAKDLIIERAAAASAAAKNTENREVVSTMDNGEEVGVLAQHIPNNHVDQTIPFVAVLPLLPPPLLAAPPLVVNDDYPHSPAPYAPPVTTAAPPPPAVVPPSPPPLVSAGELAEASTYMFTVDASSGLIVDATNKGNIARFVNHCCEPNCVARIVTIEARPQGERVE